NTDDDARPDRHGQIAAAQPPRRGWPERIESEVDDLPVRTRRAGRTLTPALSCSAQVRTASRASGNRCAGPRSRWCSSWFMVLIVSLSSPVAVLTMGAEC